MIKLKNLTRHFGNLTAVDDVSLSIPRGEICGYLGPNGAGKTTTVKMLTGILSPSAGTARICDFDIIHNTQEVKRRIGYVPESGALYKSLTAFEYLQFVGRLYHMNDDMIAKRIKKFIEFFALKDYMYKNMNEFSKGMKQKVVISAALIHNPEVIFMDEPLTGLDANTALMIKQLLRNLTEEGKTVFYCSHILDVVENLCDRVIIISQGKIVADGSVDTLKTMTKRSSLEGVFSRLTNSEDMGELARAFSQSITGEDEEQ
ncbi:MAG: ABC transporter ATP-binding protein [bacterium]